MRRAGRTIAVFCVTTATALGLAACGAGDGQGETADDGLGGDEQIVGKRWQVTEVYDDPTLPHGVPEGTVPPVIVYLGWPAIEYARVDLPEPDGPTRTTNSPLSMVRSTPAMTRTGP